MADTPKRRQEDIHREIDEITSAPERHERAATAIGRLVDEKNRAYGSSFSRSGEILRALYPEGIDVESYDDLLAITRVVDKLFRVATDRDAFGEDPWADIAGYAILAVVRRQEQQETKP